MRDGQVKGTASVCTITEPVTDHKRKVFSIYMKSAGVQEAADEVDVCVRRITAALLCPDARLRSQGAAPQDDDAAMLEDARDVEGGAAAAKPSSGFVEAPDVDAAAARLAMARDVSAAWALCDLKEPAGSGDGSGVCLHGLLTSHLRKAPSINREPDTVWKCTQNLLGRHVVPRCFTP